MCLLSTCDNNAEPSSDFAIKFKLHKIVPYTTDPSQTVDVLSGDLEWIPMTDTQKELWKDDPPRPVYPDIVIGKLRQGQEIELLCYAVRGFGKIHAKWSPVCTATYRLKPDIIIKEVRFNS